MTWIDLGNPTPWAEPREYRPVSWPEGMKVTLPKRICNVAKTYAQIAERRRTRYSFRSLSKEMLGDLLGLTLRIQQVGNDKLGFPLTWRPAPSAGAIHPIHLVAQLGKGECWYRYEAGQHVLIELPSAIDANLVRGALNELLPSGDAAMLLFVAEPGKTFAKYANGCSLVWRDAGVLLGYFSVAAEALGLNFSPLGVTGEPWASQLVEEPGLVGVGAAFVGAAP